MDWFKGKSKLETVRCSIRYVQLSCKCSCEPSLRNSKRVKSHAGLSESKMLVPQNPIVNWHFGKIRGVYPLNRPMCVFEASCGMGQTTLVVWGPNAVSMEKASGLITGSERNENPVHVET